MEIGILKNDISEAEHVITSLLPDVKVRDCCLSVFGEALTEANLYGIQKWGVYYRKDALRLLVGSLIVLTIHRQGVWMALDRQLLQKSASDFDILNQSQDWQWDTGQWSEYTRIPSKNGYYMPSDNHSQIWPLIRRFHFAYIEKAAEMFTQLREDSQQKHMPHVLAYLRQVFNHYVPEPAYGGTGESISNPLRDIQEYKATHHYQQVSETEREAIVQSRIGQGRFREDLSRYWKKRCAVTACQTLDILRASHIKPWKISSNEERLDVYNGLLLVPNLDAAFDKGFISFADDGAIMISDRLTADKQKKLGIHHDMRITKIEKQHCQYLNYHIEHVFKPR
jgi:putative restriction endonuclease